jgi:K+-transporting ATPase ATPase C chain
MKILKDIKLHLLSVVNFGLLFPVFIWAIGLLVSQQANGLPVYKGGKLIGYENIGQKFHSNKYFWGRPSAVEYDASTSGGSNKAPNNKEYIAQVGKRINDFLQKNPEVKRNDVPSELVTASGSGLDPHISVQAAVVQIPRIARERNIDRQKIMELILRYTERPVLGLLGTERINVLKLNIALDELR